MDMTGTQVKAARERLGLTQQRAAGRWKLSQTYVSLVEQDKRPVPDRLARLLARAEPTMATGLRPSAAPALPEDLPSLLGALQYPGFEYLGLPRNVANPAAVMLLALRARVVPARVTEALPWLLVTYADLTWDWLLDQAKLANVQNRLGYLVDLARQVAEKRGQSTVVSRLAEVESQLEDARLAKEDTLGRDLTEVERQHLRKHRPPSAAHWNLLTSLRVEDLRYGV
jgi:transcriptional regulator with XRE-family HTH domain